MRDGWPKVLVMAACLVTLTVDVSSIAGLSSMVLRPMYVAAVVGLVVWRATRRRGALVVFGSMLCVASIARAVVLTFEWHWAGVAINALLAIFAFGFVRNRPEVEVQRGVG